MFAKRYGLIACLPVVVTGCAGLGKQQPAPVFAGAGAHRVVVRNPEPKPEPVPVAPQPQKLPEEIEIKPLATAPSIETVEIQPEPIPADDGQLLTPEQEQELAALEKAQQAQQAAIPEPGVPPAEAVAPSTGVPPAQPAPANTGPSPVLVEPKQELPPPPPAPPAFEPLQTFAPLSPVVGALVVAANKSSEQGNIDSATTTIERAIRIEPRNATLFYKLALLRLKQSKPRMAEDLATKSALLASGDNQLKKHSWLLIAKARDMQNNKEGAKEARAKADKF